MKTTIACALCVLVLQAAAASAATENGRYAIRGAGLIDCQTYLDEQEKQSSAYLMMGGWIDGYITGVNQYAEDTYDATSFESTELFAELIRNHCKKHPADRLFPVMNSIVAQRWPHRVTAESPLIGVRLGDKSVQMYKETLERVQQRLADKGYYELPASGKFDQPTISALAAFQKTLENYEASGFPDQATLWALFADGD